MKLRYERGGLDDIDEILAYVSERNPAAAARLAARLEHTAALLARLPFAGTRTEYPRFRIFTVGRYLIVCEIAGTEIVVHYVRHGARQRPWEASDEN